MKISIFRAGKLIGGFILAFYLAACAHPEASQSPPDRMFKKMDVDNDGKISRGDNRGRRRGVRDRRRSRRGRSGPRLKGQTTVDVLSEETLCGIGRDRRCDIKLSFERGLIETGLEPVFPKSFDCHGIDEAWAIDYSFKRSRVAYHGGIDMPAVFGTPIIAAAAGTVVARYEGRGSFRGREIIIRHSPEDTGLPVWVYTQYAHFDRMPKQEVGQRVKMGEVLGPTGNSGKQSLQARRERRPAIHFAVWFSNDPRYVPLRRKVIPVAGYWMDPIALYRKGPPFDSHSMKALPKDKKQVPVSVMTMDGEVIPAGAKVVWPYFCEGS